jgi:hypothetical protein
MTVMNATSGRVGQVARTGAAGAGQEVGTKAGRLQGDTLKLTQLTPEEREIRMMGRQVFNAADVDGDRGLSVDEVKGLVWEGASDAEKLARAKKFVEFVDVGPGTPDGRVSFSEFIKYFTKDVSEYFTKDALQP